DTRIRPDSIEPARGVRQHGVDLAGFRGEIAAHRGLAAVVARHLLQQSFELRDIAVDGAHEVALTAVTPADLLEGALALHRVELAREYVALAAIVALPKFGRRLVVDHAGDIDRERVERFEAGAPACGRLLRRLAVHPRSAQWFAFLGCAGEEIGEPARAPAARLRGTERRRLGAAARYGGRAHSGDVGPRARRLAAPTPVGEQCFV